MKLVINIPDYVKEQVDDGKGEELGIPLWLAYEIANGTPLPKGHGRLIDADTLKKDDEVTEWLSLNAVRTGKMLKSFSELFIKKIDATQTIIEADKGESEE